MKSTVQAHMILTRMRWLRALAVAVVVVPLMSASGTIGYRLAMWRVDSRAAAAVAADTSATDAQRIRALVAMHAIAADSFAMIDRIAQEPGAVGAHARNLLAATKR